MVNAAFYFEDFSSIKRESSELVDDVLAFYEKVLPHRLEYSKFSHEKSAWYASICAVIAHTSLGYAPEFSNLCCRKKSHWASPPIGKNWWDYYNKRRYLLPISARFKTTASSNHTLQSLQWNLGSSTHTTQPPKMTRPSSISRSNWSSSSRKPQRYLATFVLLHLGHNGVIWTLLFHWYSHPHDAY